MLKVFLKNYKYLPWIPGDILLDGVVRGVDGVDKNPGGLTSCLETITSFSSGTVTKITQLYYIFTTLNKFIPMIVSQVRKWNNN